MSICWYYVALCNIFTTLLFKPRPLTGSNQPEPSNMIVILPCLGEQTPPVALKKAKSKIRESRYVLLLLIAQLWAQGIEIRVLHWALVAKESLWSKLEIWLADQVLLWYCQFILWRLMDFAVMMPNKVLQSQLHSHILLL